jgi:heat shock protein HtpX
VNNLKTGLLLTVLSVLFVFVGYTLAGQQGAVIAFVFALAMNVFSYWFSDKIVLRMYRAQEVTEAQAPELYNIVADLAQRAQVPMPRVYMIPSPALNAFATGRNPKHAVVAVTEGLMKSLDRSEVTAVLAHELSHVKHRDILIGSVAATVAAAVSMVASMARWSLIFGGMRSDDREGGNPLAVMFVAMFAGMAAMLVQMAISRSREYEADAGAARMIGEPMSMINALKKLEYAAQRVPMDANPATAHMFIVSPLSGVGGVMKLFSTHPSIEDRISRLQSMMGSLHR